MSPGDYEGMLIRAGESETREDLAWKKQQKSRVGEVRCPLVVSKAYSKIWDHPLGLPAIIGGGVEWGAG